MLIKLRIDEVIGQQALAYDLLDGQGNVVYRAGETVEAKDLKKQASLGLFRTQDRLPMEWYIQEELPEVLNHPQLSSVLNTVSTLEAELKLPYLINREEAVPCLNTMFAFWQKVETGEQLDMALLEIIQHQLIGDIISRMDELQYLNQLRIRDDVTYSHTLDVTAVSIALGAKLGLCRSDLELLALGALLHDLGKLFIPKNIMFKPTRLTHKEFEIMQMHPEIGYRILKEELKLPDEVARPALEHQELYEGNGYPQNLYKDEIHFFSQIVKIADVYDALTSRRPYKESICSEKAIKIMLLEGSKSFNPSILKSFLELANFQGEVPADISAA